MKRALYRVGLVGILIASQSANAAVVKMSNLYYPSTSGRYLPVLGIDEDEIDFDKYLSLSKPHPEFLKTTKNFSLKEYIRKQGLISRIGFENPEDHERFVRILETPDGGRLAADIQNDELELLKYLSFDQIHDIEISNRNLVCQGLGADHSVEVSLEPDPEELNSNQYYDHQSSSSFATSHKDLLKMRSLESGHKPLEFFREQRKTFLESLGIVPPEFHEPNKYHWGRYRNGNHVPLSEEERMAEFREEFRPIAEESAISRYLAVPDMYTSQIQIDGRDLKPAIPELIKYWKGKQLTSSFLLVNQSKRKREVGQTWINEVNGLLVLGENDYLKLLLERVKVEQPNTHLVCEGDFEKIGDHYNASKKQDPTSLLTDPSCLTWFTYKKNSCSGKNS